MKIRKLKKGDIKEFSVLMLELYKKWDKIDPLDKIDKKWFCSKKQYSYVEKLMKKKNNVIFVAEDNNKLVGYLMANVELRKPFHQKAGYIAETFTLPRHRGKGVAKKLVAEAFRWFKKHKLKWYIVGTHSMDREANSFWHKRGFKEFNKILKLKA